MAKRCKRSLQCVQKSNMNLRVDIVIGDWYYLHSPSAHSELGRGIIYIKIMARWWEIWQNFVLTTILLTLYHVVHAHSSYKWIHTVGVLKKNWSMASVALVPQFAGFLVNFNRIMKILALFIESEWYRSLTFWCQWIWYDRWTKEINCSTDRNKMGEDCAEEMVSCVYICK